MTPRPETEVVPPAVKMVKAPASPIRLAMIWFVGLLSLAAVAWGWTVIITHQLAAATACDPTIASGAIVQDGPHRDLPASDGVAGRPLKLQTETTA